MSRNNVFKLSGNMALGSSEPYNNEISDIKQSLKLLKAKQNQRKFEEPELPFGSNGAAYTGNVPSRSEQANKNNNVGKTYDSFDLLGKKPPPSSNYQDEPLSYAKHPSGYEKAGKRSKNEEEYDQIYRQTADRARKQNTQVPYPETYSKKQLDRGYNQPQQKIGSMRQTSNQQRNYNLPPERATRQTPNSRQTQERVNYSVQQRNPNHRGNSEMHNVFEDASIKEVNKQNRVQVVQYDPSELVECGEGCGRKFNPESISKHEAICKNVFQNKRKAFNTQEQRIINNEQKKLMKKGEAVEKKLQQKKAQQKVPKWKAESLQLRFGLQKQTGNAPKMTKEEQRMLQQANQESHVKCQYCGRVFNEKAGTRHVAFCEQQSKKNAFKTKK